MRSLPAVVLEFGGLGLGGGSASNAGTPGPFARRSVVAGCIARRRRFCTESWWTALRSASSSRGGLGWSCRRTGIASDRRFVASSPDPVHRRSLAVRLSFWPMACGSSSMECRGSCTSRRSSLAAAATRPSSIRCSCRGRKVLRDGSKRWRRSRRRRCAGSKRWSSTTFQACTRLRRSDDGFSSFATSTCC